MLISIAIPCYRSSKTLPVVVRDIQTIFASQTEYDYQLVLVNDGSPDDGATSAVIRQLCEQDKKIIGVELSRNFGQACAKMAALEYVRGDCLIYMDDDGQHPVEGIFQIVSKLQEGYDVVYAHFANKKHSAFKRITSNMFRSVEDFLGVKPKGIYVSSFIGWSKFAINAVKQHHNPSPSPGAYLMTVSMRFANVAMPHKDRMEGESGYTLRKLLRLALSTMTSFTMIPLRLSAFLGALVFGIGLINGIVTLIQKLILPMESFAHLSLMSVLLILGGLILMSLALIGEYIGNIYMMLSNKPQYAVREVFGITADERTMV